MNTKAGKKLAAKLEQPGLVFDVSDHLIKTLKLSRCVAGPAATRTGMALYYSVAGWAHDTLLVKIPQSDKENADPMPGVPSWLREVKESEWLAVQGK